MPFPEEALNIFHGSGPELFISDAASEPCE